MCVCPYVCVLGSYVYVWDLESRETCVFVCMCVCVVTCVCVNGISRDICVIEKKLSSKSM